MYREDGMARRKAPKTWDQIEAMRQKAIRFLRDVVQDEEKAQEFEAMSTRQYAAHKGIQAADNPSRQNAKIIQRSREMAKRKAAPSRAELEDTIEQLESEIEGLQGELEETEEERDALAEQVEQIEEVLGVETVEEEEGDEEEDDQGE